MSIHATDEAGKFAPVVADKNLKQDVEVAPLTPDFTSVVVKGGGLWPQLHCAPDGTLLALGYNAPGHTTLPGDVDCWASADGGKSWEKRGTAAPRPDKDANYCDSCSGFAANGDLILLSGGFEDAANAQGKRKPVKPIGVFRSADLGKSWKKEGDFPRELREGVEWRPFGTVAAAPDKTLRTVVYAYRGTEEIGGYMMTSRDDGRTWGEPVIIADKINESVLLPLDGKGWLCVARTTEKPAPERGQELRQFRSSDDGKHGPMRACSPAFTSTRPTSSGSKTTASSSPTATAKTATSRHGSVTTTASHGVPRCVCFKPAATWDIPVQSNFPMADWSRYSTRIALVCMMATTWVLSAGKHLKSRMEPIAEDEKPIPQFSYGDHLPGHHTRKSSCGRPSGVHVRERECRAIRCRWETFGNFH